MTLRTKLSLILCALLALSIGATGSILIYESASNMRKQLAVELRLFAENRAFALRDNLQILESELLRLALAPQIDLADDDPVPESQLLESSHGNSVLYNTAVLLLSAEGACVDSVPRRPEYRQLDFSLKPWFLAAKEGQAGPIFRTTQDPVVGRTLNIIQPIFRKKRFSGALVGIVALDQANLIIPALSENLPPLTSATLVNERGEVVFPTDVAMAQPHSDWAKVIHAALTESSGTRSGLASGEDSIFAFAKVHAASGYVVIFRRPWSVLANDVRQQARVLGGILLFGLTIALAAGLALAASFTQPLHALSLGASRIAKGDLLPFTDVPRRILNDEMGLLVQAFLDMSASIRLRDQELREAAMLLEGRVEERTRQLADTQQALVEAERFAAMGKTSAAIAHEIRNTLNGLGMAVDLILEDPTNTTRIARLRPQVFSEIARLRNVVDSLLSFSRSPRVDLALENVAEISRRAVTLLEELAQDRQVRLTLDAPRELVARCDGQKLQGVIVNLVKNAIEAGTVVQVRVRSSEERVWITVADDGPGFSADALAHLFEPFFTTKPNGTGLGLPTSLRYVEAHGGRLTSGTDATLGGACMSIELPRKGNDEADRTGD